MQLIRKLGFFNKYMLVGLMTGCLVMPAGAALDTTGCDDTDHNQWINPDLALCSTHAYNIGSVINPSKNNANKQLMDNVVALKTTLITQQMYSQYEILETTVKRLRTQLEKEVLMAKLKVASGNTSSSSGVYVDNTSSDKYVKLAGAENCLDRYTTEKDVLNCELRNLDKISNAVSNNTGDAKKQLHISLETTTLYNVQVNNKPLIDGIDACEATKTGGNRDNIINCVRQAKAVIGRHLDHLSNQNNNSQRNNNS